MAMNAALGLRPEAVWDLLHATIDDPASIGMLLKDLLMYGLNFHDDFSRTAVDATVWTSGGDGGSFAVSTNPAMPTNYVINTGGGINNDRYIHGDGVTGNKRFSIDEDGFGTVDWRSRLSVDVITNVSAFIGLLRTAIVDYAEPVASCAHFLVDPAVSGTFRARSYQAAEEETDTLIALDTDFHDFRIVWTAASVLFYIDGALVATHAAQVPTTPMLSEILVRSEAAGGNTITMDHVRVEVTP